MLLKKTTLFGLLFLVLSCQPELKPDIPRKQATILDAISAADIPPGLNIYPPLFRDSIDRLLASGKVPRSKSYMLYNIIGDHQKVKQMTDQELDFGLDTLLEKEANKLKGYNLVPAKDYIVKQAEQHQVVIIAESHYRPEHRVLTRSLLAGLYERGYRHIGFENLFPFPQNPTGQPFDSKIQERGYPVYSDFSGVYASEPQLGNLVREATRLGMQIFAYERNGSSQSERDVQFAEHLINYQKQHPGEKIVCHGGWYHAIEEPIEKNKGGGAYWFAHHYKTMTGDDPLTVYQDAFNQKFAPGIKTSPYYNRLLELNNEQLAFSSVAVNADGDSWRGPTPGMPFDIVTIEAPTTYEDGIPNWLFDQESCYFEVSKKELTQLKIPILLMVTGRTDSQIATPVFSMQYDELPNTIKLPLPEGDYRLEAWDKHGKRVQIEFMHGC